MAIYSSKMALFNSQLLKIGILLCASVLITSCSLPLPSFLNKQQAALKVLATPKAEVEVNGQVVGTTPYYGDHFEPGDYTVRVKPLNSIGQVWEGSVMLSPFVETIISRELGETETQSSGYVLTLDPIPADSKASSLVITTSPDRALVSIDGQPRGFAPTALEDLTNGDHVVLISSPGYMEKTVHVNLAEGHRLGAQIQLAKMDSLPIGKPLTDKSNAQPKEAVKDKEEKTPTEKEDAEEVLDADLDLQSEDEEEDIEPTPKPSKKTPTPPYVTILDTPTGWLNIRSEPSTLEDNIVLKAEPGEMFKYLDKNTNGWLEIELEDGKKGWIVAKYVKLTEK